MAADRGAVNAQLAGDAPLRPATPTQGMNGVAECHREVVRHDGSPQALGNTVHCKWRTIISSKWLLFKRPEVAAIERPLTGLSTAEIAMSLGVSRNTVFRYFRLAQAQATE